MSRLKDITTKKERKKEKRKNKDFAYLRDLHPATKIPALYQPAVSCVPLHHLSMRYRSVVRAFVMGEEIL